LAAGWLLRRYAGRVQVEFLDVADPAVAQSHAAVLEEVEKRHWMLPAVTIEGELVLMEWFSPWGIVDAVEDWLAAHQPNALEADETAV
jgi:hypothetical protein